MAEPVLSLDTLVERRTISVDGTHYELRNAAEFSLLDFHQLGRKSQRVDALMTVERELTDEEVQQLEGLLDWVCGAIFLAPPEIRARLRFDQKLAVIQAFTQLQRGTARPAGVEAPAPAAKAVAEEPAAAVDQTTSTGESTSPA